MMTTLKADPLSYPPRGLSREEAARYLGIGATLFNQLVDEGVIPRPKRLKARMIWDRVALDMAFAELPDDDKSGLQALLDKHTPRKVKS